MPDPDTLNTGVTGTADAEVIRGADSEKETP